MLKKYFSIITIFTLLVSICFAGSTLAYETREEVNKNEKSLLRAIGSNDLSGKEFFIKNLYTGQYIDVAGGNATNGTNIQQYTYNGTDSQRWYLKNNGDNTCSFYSRLGNDGSYRYSMDISDGKDQNGANVQLWEINGTNAQRFKLMPCQFGTYAIFTENSNYKKAIVLSGPTLNSGGNIELYTFQNHINEVWILEPVEKNAKFRNRIC